MEEIVIVALCLLLNSLLSAFEMAFVSMPKVEIRRLARNGNHIAQRLLPLRESPERTLSVIQIGITLVGAISAAVGGAGASESIEPYFISTLGMSEYAAELTAIMLVVIPITYLSVVIGELVPKTLAMRNPSSIALFGARFLFIANRLLDPVITVLENSTKFFVRVFFKKSTSKATTVDESAVELTHYSQQHRQYIMNMAAIEKKSVQDVYVPWNEVAHIDLNETIENVSALVFKTGHTRMPVTQHGAVVGIIHTKEFLALRELGITDWVSSMRPAMKVKGTDSALNVLKIMQEKRSHLAIVDDCKGIITLEDINYEIYGEMFDEYEDGRIQKLIASKARSRLSPKPDA